MPGLFVAALVLFYMVVAAFVGVKTASGAPKVAFVSVDGTCRFGAVFVVVAVRIAIVMTMVAVVIMITSTCSIFIMRMSSGVFIVDC